MENDTIYSGFQSRLLHDGLQPESWEGATLPPIVQSASHRHLTAESLSETFSGQRQAHIYMRLSNPTVSVLEEKVAALEGGGGAIYMASGMAAIANTCMALLRAGDEFIAGRSLFMSTYLLFTRVFAKYDITCHLCDPLDLDGMSRAINDRTRFIYLETIGNPAMDIPDLEQAARLAHSHGLPLVVDNTLASPWLCRPVDFGADVVLHSTTKYLSGHGNAVGGLVVDCGRFDWLGSGRFSDFAPFVDRKGPLALRDRIWREHHINYGTTGTPFHAYLTIIGMDTLALRMERHMDNAGQVAAFLTSRPEVSRVCYPGLAGHPCHQTAARMFSGRGFGGMLTFFLDSQDHCFRFIDALQMILHLANLGDCRSLVLHPASSQYVSFTEEERRHLDIADTMVRLSVGLEDIEDILADLEQALDRM